MKGGLKLHALSALPLAAYSTTYDGNAAIPAFALLECPFGAVAFLNLLFLLAVRVGVEHVRGDIRALIAHTILNALALRAINGSMPTLRSESDYPPTDTIGAGKGLLSVQVFRWHFFFSYSSHRRSMEGI